MRRAVSVVRNGGWDRSQSVGTVTLFFEDRHKRRLRMRDDGETPFLLDLPEATMLCDGDGLALDQGGFLTVRAALEKVADIACQDADHMARVAWHIGNRHLALQVLGANQLRILDDRVILKMIEGLGADVEHLTAPFQPEPGAYAHGH